MITQKRVKELLNYNPENGNLIWRVNKGRAKQGEVAGTLHKDGHILVGVDGERYQAHRLIWLWMEGYFPENDIDHKDRLPSNNKWCNLRHTSHKCNMRNCSISKNNKSGVTGVSWNDKNNKWFASITVDYKSIGCGIYSNFIDAVRSRWEAEKKYSFPNCNTTSSAYEYLKENSLI